MKRIIKLTESDLTNIVKKVLKEAGGYDDIGIMAMHGQATTGMLQSVIQNINRILSDTEKAFESNMGKEDIMGGITLIVDVLSQIKEGLKKITPELVNDDLKLAAKDLFIGVRGAEKKLRLIANQTGSSMHPDMPPAMVGMGFAMSPEDVNDFLFNIVLDLGKSAEKLGFQVKDEIQILTRRLSNN